MSETAASTECLNCAASFHGAFCPECGQKASTGRLQLRELPGQIADTLFNFDGRVPRTVLGLLREPGRVCRDYVEGRRVRYVEPFRYCVTILAIVILVNVSTGFDGAGIGAEPEELSGVQQEARRLAVSMVMRHFDWILFAVLPIFILVVRRFFGRRRYNYAEVGVFVLYLTAQIMLYGLFLVPLRVVSVPIAAGLKILMQIGLLAWAGRTFFDLSSLSSLARSVAATLVYYLLVVAVIVLFVLPRILPLLRPSV